MRFDWYQTTINADPARVLEVIAGLGDSLEPADGLARMYRGDRAYRVMDVDSNHVATFVSGGSYGTGKAHAWASGDATDAFVEVVRGEWPLDHIVTRMDSCEDFYDGGARSKITRTMREFAKAKKLHFEVRAKPLDPTLGETFYIGSNQSENRVRGYDKGYEVFNRFKGAFEKVGLKIPLGLVTTNDGQQVDPEHWFRLELQARPKDKAARSIAAKLSPREAWALGSWVSDFAKEVFSLELERQYMRTKKLTSQDRKLRWMCAQYGSALVELVRNEDTYDHAMQRLLDIIRSQGRVDMPDIQ